MRSTIPRQQHESRPGPFTRVLYRLRQRVERLINRGEQYRRFATRDEKRAVTYKTMWVIAATILWLAGV
jgi:transposase